MHYFLIIAVLAVIGYLLYKETTTLSVSRYDFSSEKIPEEFNEYKIVHLSDLHNTANKSLITQITDVINSEKPDLIALTGDLADSHRPDWNSVRALSDLLKRFAPVYFVTGNHEERLFSNNADDFDRFNELGLIMLHNQAVSVKRKDSRIQLAGVDDPRRSGRSRGSEPDEFIREELNNLKLEEGLFTILLSHRPEYLEYYARKNIDLVLAGHAHGAQFILPLLGGVFAPNQGLFPRYYQGMHLRGKTAEIISRGISGKEFPFRINNKPEIAVITLSQKK